MDLNRSTSSFAWLLHVVIDQQKRFTITDVYQPGPVSSCESGDGLELKAN